MASAEQYLNKSVEEEGREEEVEEELENYDSMADSSPPSSSEDDDDDDDDLDDSLSDDFDDAFDSHHSSARQEAYKVLTAADIRKCQEDAIMNISAVLSVPTAEATILLLHCNWNVNEVPDRWFADEEKLRREVGLLKIPVVATSGARFMDCGVCARTFGAELLTSASCGHLFCHKCWAGYIANSVKDGMRCLMLKCPVSSCYATLTHDMINILASEEDKFKYAHYFHRSYIEYNKKAKWCPAPYCNSAVLLIRRSSSSKVTCKCLYSFCWKCTKEAHQPVSCAKVSSWEMESLLQSDNWMIANNKKCPNCERPMDISRHQKLTECFRCNFQFCSLCLGSWLGNGQWEGDHFIHVCSELKLEEAERARDETRQKEAEEAMVRYHNYLARWKSHDMDQQYAIVEIQKLRNQRLAKVAETYRLTSEEISSITEAWLQIRHCKRTLKWVCVYDYYLVPYEKERQSLLDYLQRQGQIVLERLYQCADRLKQFLNVDEPSDQFIQFRERLCLQTSVARNYFESMIWAIEKGSSDLSSLLVIMSSKRAPGETAMAMADTKNDMMGKAVDETGRWFCAYCQFPNDVSASICMMCHH